MAAYTVDTDGTSGDYASLSAAIAAIDDAALTEDVTVTCYATDSDDDTTAVDFSSINTTSDYRLTIVPGDSNYRLRLNISSGPGILLTGGFGTYSNITIQGLTIRGYGQTGNYQPTIEISHRDGTSIIEQCDIRTEAHTNRDEIINYVMDTSFSGINVIVNNLIVSGSTSTHGASRVFDFTDEGYQYFYNNTIIAGASTQALYYSADTASDDSTTWYNNLISGFAGVYNSLTPGTADYNMTDDTWDLGGANDIQEASITFVDTTDYRTASDSDAVDAGTDLSSDATYAFDDDIDDNTRSGTWDIGCSEYTSGGTTQELAGGIEAAATIAGALAVERELAGSADATAAIDGALAVTRELAGSASAQATVTGALETLRALAGAIGATGNADGALQVARYLSGAISAQATASGTLDVPEVIELAGAISAAAQADGALSVQRLLSGAVSAAASVSGDLLVAKRLAGAIAAQAAAAGDLQVLKYLSGIVGASGNAAAALEVRRLLSGSLTAEATVSASLIVGSVFAEVETGISELTLTETGTSELTLTETGVSTL